LVAALQDLAAAAPDDIEKMRAAGYAVLANHTLDRERDEFAGFVADLDRQMGI
jgi:hypothetical protein